MKKKLTLYFAILLLYLLHNDLWFWNDARLMLGLPIELLYHVGYCFAASLLMWGLVKFAWPRHLEIESEAEQR